MSGSVNLKSLPPKGFSEISGGWNSRLSRWQLSWLTKDKDSGSQCVYCWKRMARHEREAPAKQFVGTIYTHLLCSVKVMNICFCTVGLIWLCYMMLINLSLVRIVPVWPGNRSDQCLQRVRPGILCELWRAVWCLGVHRGIFGWSWLL